MNGKAFASFQEFVTFVETNTEEFLVFETEYKHELIISATDAARATDSILKRNHTSSRYSPDVTPWLHRN